VGTETLRATSASAVLPACMHVRARYLLYVHYHNIITHPATCGTVHKRNVKQKENKTVNWKEEKKTRKQTEKETGISTFVLLLEKMRNKYEYILC
jgi:hypothetical protein